MLNDRKKKRVGDWQTISGSFTKVFPALENENFRYYFFGQLISQIGTWLQMVAEGWLVFQITHSAFLVGFIAALAAVPTLLFTLFGGVVVDRFPKKKILFVTQSTAMILAVILGVLTILHIITVWQIGILAFCLGIVRAIDSPARQSFISEMVTREQLSSAIALNSAVVNTARVIGPCIAGFLIACIGAGGAFIINGLSYWVVLAALFAMKAVPYSVGVRINAFRAIKEGVSYTINHPLILSLLLFTGLSSIFARPYTTIMPVIAQNIFHLGAVGLGYLYAASGLGSLLATFFIGAFAKRFSPIYFIIGGNTLFALSLFCFSFTANLYMGLFLLFFVGFGLLSQAAMMNTVIQQTVKSELRGRVMSIYILMFLGFSPLGSLQIGFASEKFGSAIAFRIGAVMAFIGGIILFMLRNKIRIAYLEYKSGHQS